MASSRPPVSEVGSKQATVVISNKQPPESSIASNERVIG
jgi:hypothetical protein